MNQNVKTNRAFTLIEVLAVIAIIGVLAALTVGLYSRVKGKSVESAIHAEMEQVKLALQAYKEKHGFFPPDSGPDDNRLYFHLSGEAQLAKHFGGLAQLRAKTPEQIKRARTSEGIHNLLPDLKPAQYDDNGALYSPVPDEGNSNGKAKWIYESGTPVHNRETYDLSVKIWDKDDNGKRVLVREIGNW